jgi:hypothetical protein
MLDLPYQTQIYQYKGKAKKIVTIIVLYNYVISRLKCKKSG